MVLIGRKPIRKTDQDGVIIRTIKINKNSKIRNRRGTNISDKKRNQMTPASPHDTKIK